MRLNKMTIGQLERLALLGCPVVIRDGEAHAPLSGLLLSRLAAIAHAFRVRSLRRYWLDQRRLDWQLCYRREAFEETYMITRYHCREVLPNEWFRRA